MSKKTIYENWKEENILEDKLILITAWARNGLTLQQIADNLGLNRDTFSEYKKKYSDISEALKKGKDVVDIEVENALLKRALGYSYEEVTVEDSEKNGKTIKKVIKQVVPDTTAQIFWLKNRKVKEWRDKQELEHSGGIDIKIVKVKK